MWICYNIVMDNDIIVALIGLTGVCCGGLFGYMGRSKKQAIREAMRQQEQSDMFSKIFEEMQQIKTRLDEHNNYAEKIGRIEKSIISIKKDIEYLRKDKDEKEKKS